MEAINFLSMVNNINDATKSNLKKILYCNDSKSEVFNRFDGPNKLLGSHGCRPRD